MSYEVPRRLLEADVAAIRPGTSLLLTGPSDRSEELVYDLLACGHDNGEHAVFITTDAGAAAVVEALEARTGNFDPGLLGIVDTTDPVDVGAAVPVERLGSSGDLTGISLGTAKLVRRMDGGGPVRLGLVSISTLLMYVDLRTAFRFLHVFTSRVAGGEWLGLFTLDPAMHDDQTLGTLRALFDGELALGESADDGEGVTVRGSGFVRTE